VGQDSGKSRPATRGPFYHAAILFPRLIPRANSLLRPVATIKMTTIVLSSLSQNAGTEVSGILGFITLNQLDVKIDYRDGLVDFVFKPR
jgi:hypothetical protein